MPLAPGDFLGPYEIIAAIDGGGMGEVYRAREKHLGRTVAIKVLPPDVDADDARLARFEAEARLASSLNHPNIITIYGAGCESHVHYIAMELVEGPTLRALLDVGPMPVAVALEIAVQIASGLEKAHGAGIVHRDLKPRNVMVTPDGLVKILDFGISKLAGAGGDADASFGLTAPGMLIGTPEYMSPEQAAGRAVDARSDQFSFGTMLYEMIGGRNPFRRDSRLATLAAIVSEEPAAVREINTDVPETVSAIVHRCLCKDPLRRFATTAELTARLREAERAIGVRVPRPWRSRALAAVAVVLAAVAIPAYDRLVRRPAAEVAEIGARSEIAVLPFVTVGDDASNTAFSDGLVETLTTKLTQVEQSQGAFRVVPATEIRRERIVSVREARQTFAATLAITGSVQRSADRLRLTVNLVDANTLRQVGARTIDVDARDVSAIQDGVVLEVIEMLGLELGSETRAQLVAGGTASPGAFDYYLQGKGYMQRFERRENIDSAIELFKRALAEDGRFALAHAGLAEAYWRRYETTRNPGDAKEARAEGERALELNDRLAQVRITLAVVERGVGAYESALGQLRQALAIDPASPDALRELARTHEALGDLTSAEAAYLRAIKVRPVDWIAHNDLGRFYFSRGRYADAAVQFEEVVKLTPDNQRGHSNLGGVYAQLQRFPEAIAAFRKSISLRPTDTAYSNLGTIYFRQQRYTEAARTFEQAVALKSANYRVWLNLGMSYYWAPGERDKAPTAFEKVVPLAEQELKVNARRPTVVIDLAAAHARLGNVERARSLLADVAAMGPLDGTMTFNMAAALEDIGDRSRAIDAVRKALELGYPKEQVEQARSLEELRKDPQYQRMIRSLS